MKRVHCRACNACGLQEVLDLGKQPPSNSLLVSVNQVETEYPLRLVLCRACNLLQLDYDVPHEELFSSAYPFYSGSVAGTVSNAPRYAKYMTDRLGLTTDSLVVEIGGNDGTVLKEFNTHKLNFEVSPGPAKAAADIGVPTIVQRWGQHTYLPTGQPDFIYANNAFAHDPDPQAFVRAIADNLAAGGTFSAQFPWALRMIEQCQFDTIYHEHYSYFTLRALIPLFAEWGLTIYDAEELSIHGGSLQIMVSQVGTYPVTQRVADLLDLERAAGLERLETYWKFGEKARSIRANFESFLISHRHERIFAFGAAAKGNTFLNWLQVGAEYIEAVADTTPAKIGKFLPGTRIPIVSEIELQARRPDYVVILPWNWADSIADKLHYMRGRGAQFVTAIPELKVF